MSATKEATELLARIGDYAGRDVMLREAFMEVSTALADILSLMEKSNGVETAKAVAAGLRNLKVQAEMSAPDITIKVSPTPIEVNVKPTPIEVTVQPAQVHVPQPLVQIMPAKDGPRITGADFEFAPSGAIKGFTLRRG